MIILETIAWALYTHLWLLTLIVGSLSVSLSVATRGDEPKTDDDNGIIPFFMIVSLVAFIFVENIYVVYAAVSLSFIFSFKTFLISLLIYPDLLKSIFKMLLIMGKKIKNKRKSRKRK